MLSLIIPTFNEHRRIPGTLTAWFRFISESSLTAEIIVVDDGSTDGTLEYVSELLDSHSNLRLLSTGRNLGKGAAVKAGMLAAKGSVHLFADADLDVSPAYTLEVLEQLNRGFDLVIGGRGLLQYSRARRKVSRLIAGGIFQLTRRALFLSNIRDTQCGFKGFERDLSHAIFSQTQIYSFAFDVEVLFLARKMSAKIGEITVDVSYDEDSRVILKKHFWKDITDLFRIRLFALRGGYKYVQAFANKSTEDTRL